MNPFFFGTSKRQLFGAHDPPQVGGRRGVVVCHPLAREYLLAYPTVRHLARSLSSNGWHVLRFDYFGTGDSAGELADASQDQWLTDIQTAVEELKDIGQLSQIGLIGMRYGAALAARTASRRRDIERLVLWDPVFDGRAYLDELGVRGAPTDDGGGLEVKGVVLTEGQQREMESTTVTSFGPDLPRTLIVNTLRSPNACEPLRAHLAAAGVDCSVEHVPDVLVWREEWGRGGVGMAVSAVNRILAWMS